MISRLASHPLNALHCFPCASHCARSYSLNRRQVHPEMDMVAFGSKVALVLPALGLWCCFGATPGPGYSGGLRAPTGGLLGGGAAGGGRAGACRCRPGSREQRSSHGFKMPPRAYTGQQLGRWDHAAVSPRLYRALIVESGEHRSRFSHGSDCILLHPSSLLQHARQSHACRAPALMDHEANLPSTLANALHELHA
jgi:hypothetical protein